MGIQAIIWSHASRKLWFLERVGVILLRPDKLAFVIILRSKQSVEVNVWRDNMLIICLLDIAPYLVLALPVPPFPNSSCMCLIVNFWNTVIFFIATCISSVESPSSPKAYCAFSYTTLNKFFFFCGLRLAPGFGGMMWSFLDMLLLS